MALACPALLAPGVAACNTARYAILSPEVLSGSCPVWAAWADLLLPIFAGVRDVPVPSTTPRMLLAVVCDRRLAFVSGWVCGILAMVLIPAWQPVHWAQIFVEHLVCFSCLGYTGIFGTDKRWKILCGGILAIFIKFWAHVFSGVIFFSQNAWDGWGAWGYSLAFNLSSRLSEGILSILIVSVLPLTLMRRAIARREAK